MEPIGEENTQLVKQKKNQSPSPPPKMKQTIFPFVSVKTMRNLTNLLGLHFQRHLECFPFYFNYTSLLAKLRIISIAAGTTDFKSSMGS